MPSKTVDGLRDLYTDELKDVYDAEKQVIEALPKMAQAATSDQLRQGFEMHLEQTQGHLERLQQILGRHGINPGNKKCVAMQGIIKEGDHAIKLKGDNAVRDAALIAAAQRVEHYEIAAYGTLRAFAKDLNHGDDMALLDETLQEEGDTDKKLTKLAQKINQMALTTP